MYNNIKSNFNIKDSIKKENFKSKKEIDFGTKKIDDILNEFNEKIEEKFPSSEFKKVKIDKKVEIVDNGLKCTVNVIFEKSKR